MITQNQLKEELDYNPETGLFIRRKSGTGKNKGDIAGTKDKDGYIIIRVYNKRYKAHRLAWLYMYGSFPSKEIDHINREKADNRINNLREVAQGDNRKNQDKTKRNCSGRKGVSYSMYHKKPYRVYCSINGVNTYLGMFETLEEAGNVYDEAAKKYHGEYYYKSSLKCC
jgi:hypothetical protein